MLSSGTGSLAIWVRSPSFEPKVSVFSPTNTFIGYDTGSGYRLTGDSASAAINIQLTQSGNYQIQLSSSNGSYGSGNFYSSISPGADFKFQYFGTNPTSIVEISSSNYIAICDVNAGAQLVFYNIGTNTIDKWYNNITGSRWTQTYGACYSKAQNRVFALMEDNNILNTVVAEFDKTGSLITSHSIAPFNQIPNICYDNFNDRIFLLQNFDFPSIIFAVWDCASRTIVGATTHSISPFNTYRWSTYSEINNRYYVTNGGPLIWIDASNFNNSGSTVSSVGNFIEYIPGTNVIAGNSGSICLMNPLTDTISYSSSEHYSDGGPYNDQYNLVGGTYDICDGLTVLAVDKGSGAASIGGILCIDSNFNVSNFIPIHQSTGNGEYTYGIKFVQTGSRVYVATTDYDHHNRLYSCKISIPTGSTSP